MKSEDGCILDVPNVNQQFQVSYKKNCSATFGNEKTEHAFEIQKPAQTKDRERQASSYNMMTTSNAKSSRKKYWGTKKMLSPMAKVFIPGKYGVTAAEQNRISVKPKPYFLPMQQFVSVGSLSAPLLVNQWPQVQTIEKALNAKPGYWYMGGRDGVVIPGLGEYPPAELARVGAIIPVPWLPVE